MGHVVAHMKCYFGYSYLKDSQEVGRSHNDAIDLTASSSSSSLSYVGRKRSRETTDANILEPLKFKLSQQPDSENIDIDWFVLTSSNLSKVAWGEYQLNNTQIAMHSYEIGVMWMPSKIMTTKRVFSLTPDHPLLGNDEISAADSVSGDVSDLSSSSSSSSSTNSTLNIVR